MTEQEHQGPQYSTSADEAPALIDRYSSAFQLLRDFDQDAIRLPEGTPHVGALSLDTARAVIAELRSRFPDRPSFGVTSEESLRRILVESAADSDGVTTSAPRGAARLLHRIASERPFEDGNLVIAAALALHHLHQDSRPTSEATAAPSNNTIIAATVMAARSDPADADTVLSLLEVVLTSL